MSSNTTPQKCHKRSKNAQTKHMWNMQNINEVAHLSLTNSYEEGTKENRTHKYATQHVFKTQQPHLSTLFENAKFCAFFTLHAITKKTWNRFVLKRNMQGIMMFVSK